LKCFSIDYSIKHQTFKVNSDQGLSKMSRYPAPFRVYDHAAEAVLGDSPKLELLFENNDYPFAHEAGVFIPESNTLFVTSNQYPHPQTNKTHIQITRITLPSSPDSTETTCTEITAPDIPLPNGGVNYKNGILFCAQGTPTSPGGLAYMPLPASHSSSATYSASLLITSFHARPFNSPNDVVIHSDGSIWFTDPVYGSEQGIRPPPELPNQVYRFDPSTRAIRAVADGFGRPNGICFAPDEQTCYVTDTDWIHGDGSTDGTRASHM
jgi:gluconolactonase